MTLEITYSSVIYTLILALVIIVVIYLVKALKGVADSTKRINDLLDGNRKNIDATIESLPRVCKNVEDITSSLKGKTDLLDNLISGGEEAATSDGSYIENLITSISSVVDIFSEISGMFGRKKRKRR